MLFAAMSLVLLCGCDAELPKVPLEKVFIASVRTVYPALILIAQSKNIFSTRGRM
jgi:hypothetical protein